MEVVAAKNVFLVDDHPVVRLGLVHLIETDPNLVVVGQASSAEEALTSVTPHTDVVVTDLKMAGLDGVALTRLLKVSRPHLPVLVVSSYHESLFADQALSAAASGYLMKDAAVDVLHHALDVVQRGGMYLSRSMWDSLLPVRPPLDWPGGERLFQALRGVPTTDVALAARMNVPLRTFIAKRQACVDAIGLDDPLQLQLLVHWWESQAWMPPA
jgi:CheY-like chemotaxis protein